MLEFIERMQRLIEKGGPCVLYLTYRDVIIFKRILDIAKDVQMEEMKPKQRQSYTEEVTDILKKIGAGAAFIDIDRHQRLMSIEIRGTLGEDQTKKYTGMIQAMECDFNLAMDPGSRYGLDDLQVKIENHDGRIINDIELLQELSYGVRRGTVKIINTAREDRSSGVYFEK